MYEYLNKFDVRIRYTATLFVCLRFFSHTVAYDDMYLTHVCKFQSWKNLGPLKYQIHLDTLGVELK